jgi:solute carrier family 25 (adenine nucleotide translocator) protein 4/5/6/31
MGDDDHATKGKEDDFNITSSSRGEGVNKPRSNFLADFMAGGMSAVIAISLTKLTNFKRYRKHSLKGIWRVNLGDVIWYGPMKAFSFASKDYIKSVLPEYDADKQFSKLLVTNVASGGLAGATTLCILHPVDVAWGRFIAAQQGTYSGLTDCLIKTARGPSGITGLYKGFGIAIMETTPYRGIYFGMYDSLVTINPYDNRRDFTGFAIKFLIAQVTCATCVYVVAPISNVRRRLQTQALSGKCQ